MDEESTSAGSSSDNELSDESSSSNDQQFCAGEKRRQKQSCKTYFEGQSRMPYQLRRRFRTSMDGNETVLDGVCKQ